MIKTVEQHSIRMPDNMMQKSPIDKRDARYMAATIKQLPSLDDPREVRIIAVAKEQLMTTDWARSTVNQVREAVVANWRDIYSHRSDSDYVHDRTQEVLINIAQITNARIVDGEENLDDLPKRKPVFIVSNHFPFFKLISFTPDQLRQFGVDAHHPVPTIYYPFAPYYAVFSPVGQQLGINLYEASFEQPGDLGDLFRASGCIDIPPPPQLMPELVQGTGNRLGELTESTRELFAAHPNAGLVVFPEGGTTGKRSGGQIYGLEEFHTGAFVIAAKLDVPVLPVAHHFDPNKGIELAVFKPITPNASATREEFASVAEIARGEMQKWFNSKRIK